jgi:hypothetical protein
LIWCKRSRFLPYLKPRRSRENPYSRTYNRGEVGPWAGRIWRGHVRAVLIFLPPSSRVPGGSCCTPTWSACTGHRTPRRPSRWVGTRPINNRYVFFLLFRFC